MELIHSPHELNITCSSCVTIGNFDGVHKGHQTLLLRTIERAKAANLKSLCITFWPHPRSVVAPHKKHSPLSTRIKRLELLEKIGLDAVCELNFTSELANFTPAKFVEQYLVPLSTKILITGYDFCLGRNRSGHTEQLKALGQEFGFEVEQLQPLYLNGEIISSTRLRNLIGLGEMERAKELLGRFYAVQGEVIHGLGRGRDLGFPTANLSTPKTLLPAVGVYAAYALWQSQVMQAVVNIGCNPTFGANTLSVEAFLLDCNANLYGQTLELQFVKRLRNEVTFKNSCELSAQIHHDVEHAKYILQALGS